MEPKYTGTPGRRRFRLLLGITAGLTIANLFLSASTVGLVGGILILGMIWGISRGDYPLTKALRVVLLLFGIVNLVILCLILVSGTEASVSALIWLGFYSVAILILGALLWSRAVQDHLNTAKPPEKKESRFHFFHGGWRDL